MRYVLPLCRFFLPPAPTSAIQEVELNVPNVRAESASYLQPAPISRFSSCLTKHAGDTPERGRGRGTKTSYDKDSAEDIMWLCSGDKGQRREAI